MVASLAEASYQNKFSDSCKRNFLFQLKFYF